MSQRQPFREERRYGVAWKMIGTANLLETIIEGNFADVTELQRTGRMDYNLYTAREQRAMEKVVKLMRWQVKALRAVARSMGHKDPL